MAVATRQRVVVADDSRLMRRMLVDALGSRIGLALGDRRAVHEAGAGSQFLNPTQRTEVAA